MSAPPITYRGCVYPWHCDHVGHMNVMHYVGKFDEATWNFFSLLGVTPTYLRDNNVGMAAVQQNLTYRRELLPGDVVTVRTQLMELEGKKIRFVHEMENGETGEVASICEMIGVHMNTVARKSCAFPEAILARGRGMMEGNDG